MDIAQLTRAPRDVMLAGRLFKLRPFKAREWGELHQWLKDHAEDPFTAAVRQIARTKAAHAPITQEQEDYLLSEARQELRNWPPRASSSAWFELLGSVEGGDTRFLQAIIATEHPEFTEADAVKLGEMLTTEESSTLMLVALGLDPIPKPKGPRSTARKKKRPDPTRTTGRKRSTG